MALEPLVKRPGETLAGSAIAAMNFGHHPEVIAGAVLSSPSVSATPSGLTLGTPTVSGTRVLFSIAGGTDGVDYDVKVTVGVTGGGVRVETGVLKCRESGSA